MLKTVSAFLFESLHNILFPTLAEYVMYSRACLPFFFVLVVVQEQQSRRSRRRTEVRTWSSSSRWECPRATPVAGGQRFVLLVIFF